MFDISTTTSDPREVEKFNRLAAAWRDPNGQMWPLHRLNQLRAPFVSEAIKSYFNTRSLEGISILDIGCGAGLLSETLAKQGGVVTGIDAARHNISIARRHARSAEVDINYIHGAVEDFNAYQNFDIVLNMEVIEDMVNLPAFMALTCRLTRSGGLMFLATINRTWFSWFTTNIGAEYLLGWLPRGTHDWRRYVKPEDAEASLDKGGLGVKEKMGVGVNPFTRSLFLTRNMAANYMMVASKT